ncbi:hypothetical protein BJ138DRAFT_1104939 [Hygrophoropsis aurantiaca]|uniref:Uncharacterized protein n=1 Tax=Hygrophoropsis aurantiaca TaxID=72124 RepID=A0ACB8A0E8_9AGAM|nr:hypothetical protein BJ138DRAFT_1104939 [Hygrophoropsis aurantiaca]
MTDLIPENVNEARAAKVPAKWTDQITAPDKARAMLATPLGVSPTTIKDILEEKRGDQYVFASGSDFYFWNCASETAAIVTSPKGKDALWNQMDKNIMEVKVRQL